MPLLQEARIGQVSIVCQDVKRARGFYRDTLGFTHLFDAGPSLSFFESAGTRLMLSVAQGEARGTSALYFFVHDIQETARQLVERGVRFFGEPHLVARMPDHELWLAEFCDSEDNLMALMEEKR